MPILMRESSVSLEAYWRFVNEANEDNEDWVPYPTAEAVQVFIFSDPWYDPEKHWVEVADDDLVAEAAVKIQRNEYPEAVVELNIARNSRGQGLGEVLLASAVDSLSDHTGPTRVILTPGNREVVSFAKALGFEGEKMLDLVRNLEVPEVPQLPEGYRLISANKAQAQDLAELWAEVFGPDLQLYNGLSRLRARLEELQQLMSQGEVPSKVSLALHVDEAVGFSLGQFAPKVNPKEGWVAQLGVVKEHRRKGVGKALLLSSLLWLQGQGCSTVRINAMADNQPALELYKELGFRILRLKEKHLIQRRNPS